ncbi:MAG: CopG family transcriptional regulator [Ignavibacteria bacterium]|nr:CopG family transcriptional regulator [Ignavibacteria bacterium]
MTKTVTLRMDEDIYNILKSAASDEKRTISNFIEYAALNYLSSSSYISDNEMNEILNDNNLKDGLRKGMDDVKNGNYEIVE